MGLMFGIAGSAMLGAVVILIHPRWQLTFRNISWFVAGAFAGAISSSFLYSWIFADENRTLQSRAAVIGYLATLFVATLVGGSISTFVGTRLFRQPD